MIRIFRLFVLGILSLSGFARAEVAANYPSQPIKIIVPFTAGGPADNVARFIGQRLSEVWRQPVFIENRPGAGGMIGADAAAKAAPDGYTLVELVTGHTIMPGMQQKMPYQMPHDFTPIIIINHAPKLVVVNPSVPAKSFRELIALEKSEPAKYGSYGTSGVGSLAHLSMELVNELAGTSFVHIPYKGGSATLSDLLGGQLPVGVLDLGSVLPQVRDGRLKVLAVTSATRSLVLPDVPTISEILPGFEATEWFGLAGPRGIPPDIVSKLNQEIRRALSSPEAKAKYIDGLGWELPASTPEEMGIMMEQQTKKWGNLVHRLGLKAQ
jgi:tripartite-type tricarboxylate transporter receptor subunit TctC